MQKIYFRKTVDLNHQLKELVSISVDESINYKMESQGMRAIGSIMINGEYKDNTTKKVFRESIDLDILAQFEKITDKRDFHVKVEDFDYSLNGGDLALVIQACVYGVLDDEDRVIDTSMTRTETSHDVVDEIEDLLREDDLETHQDIKELYQEVVPVVELSQSEPVQVSQTPTQTHNETMNAQDIEQDDEDLGTYYLYIVQDGDTYQSIASRYQVDEYKLKDYNHDRSLMKGTIVIVPYYV